MTVLFSAWARQLAFLILFVSVIEMLLPAGELRKYVKMVLGLVVLMALIDPLLQIVRGKDWIDSLVVPTAAASSWETSPVRAGVQLSETMMQDAAGAARAETEQQLVGMLTTLEGVEHVTVDLAGTQPHVILLTQRNDTALVAKAQRLVASLTQVDPAQVEVDIQPGSAGKGGR